MAKVLDTTEIRAVIFDMDGVITDTAGVHSSAWKQLFDEYLRARAESEGTPFRPFTAQDYRRYVDGKPRYDGVASFLESRDIELPWGAPTDPPDAETVCGLGNRKNGYFLERLREDGADAYPSTIALVRDLKDADVRVAVITSSRNGQEVLSSADVEDLFEARVDGVVADDLGLPGKPAPDVFLEAAQRVGVEPDEAAVVEDAISGVEAGRRGDFGLVIGVDRSGHAEDLRQAGADIVVSDLEELLVARRISDVPSALAATDEIAERLEGRRTAIFLDYDGTLTPIVEDPEDALLPEATRSVIENLRDATTVAVVSGRDLDDVRGMVDIAGIPYAGSHGFDLLEADGTRHGRAEDYLPSLDSAEEMLGERLADITGARLERKHFAIAVHYRQVDDEDVPAVEDLVDETLAEHDDLRKTGGKRIFELRPDLDWDKGKALGWFLDMLDLDTPGVVPLYIGDDVTDEDAFRGLPARGLSVVVRGEDDERVTVADYALEHPREVREFLDWLLEQVAPR